MSVQKVLLCAFHCKPKLSKVSLGSPGLKNIPQVPGKRSENGQNHDARKAILATLSVLSEVGLYFGPEAPKWASKSYAVRISVQTNATRSKFRVPRTGKYPKSCVKSS